MRFRKLRRLDLTIPFLCVSRPSEVSNRVLLPALDLICFACRRSHHPIHYAHGRSPRSTSGHHRAERQRCNGRHSASCATWVERYVSEFPMTGCEVANGQDAVGPERCSASAVAIRGGDQSMELSRRRHGALTPLRSPLRQAGFPEAIGEVVSHICVAERLGVEPMVDREMGMGDQEQFCFSVRFLVIAQLRKRRSQEFA